MSDFLLHTPAAIEAARVLARRRMKSRCEILKTPDSRPFGSDPLQYQLVGVSACSITQATRPQELTPTEESAVSQLQTEFAFPVGVHLESEYRLAVPAFYPKWKRQTAYSVRQIVAPVDWVKGRTCVYVCLKAGTSGTSEPAWPGQKGRTVADGGCIWRLQGYATLYEVVGVNDQETQRGEIVVLCKELS